LRRHGHYLLDIFMLETFDDCVFLHTLKDLNYLAIF
jgi:hypothetical protein